MLLIIPHAGSARNERSLPAQPVEEAAPAIERTLADSRPCPRFHRQRPDDPTPGPQVLHAQARGHEHPQGRHGGTGIIRAGSRQGPPRRPDHRRSRKAPTRSSPSTSPRRWGIGRSIAVSGCRLKVEIDHGDGASAGEKAYGIWTGIEARRDAARSRFSGDSSRRIRPTSRANWPGTF